MEKNILYIAHEGLIGGASIALLSMAKHMKENGYGVYVLSPFKNSDFVKALKENDIEVVTSLYGWWQVPTNLSPIAKLAYKILYRLNFMTIYKIGKFIKKKNINIIHSNSSVVNIGALISYRYNVKHVWHYREYNQTYTRYIMNEEKSYDFINRSKSTIIYVSKSLQSYYDSFITTPDTFVIYDGVDERHKHRKDVELSSDENINFLITGSIEKNKGQVIAIKAAKLLKDRGYQNFKLCIVGSGDNNYIDMLKTLVSDYGLESYIAFLGYRNDLPILRKQMHVELMCSSLEAFGLVTIEAMQSSNPVIGSNSGATPELINEGINGFIFNRENEKDLSLKMEKFIVDRKLVHSMGMKAYDYAENFTTKRNAVEVDELYNTILKH